MWRIRDFLLPICFRIELRFGYKASNDAQQSLIRRPSLTLGALSSSFGISPASVAVCQRRNENTRQPLGSLARSSASRSLPNQLGSASQGEGEHLMALTPCERPVRVLPDHPDIRLGAFGSVRFAVRERTLWLGKKVTGSVFSCTYIIT